MECIGHKCSIIVLYLLLINQMCRRMSCSVLQWPVFRYLLVVIMNAFSSSPSPPVAARYPQASLIFSEKSSRPSYAVGRNRIPSTYRRFQFIRYKLQQGWESLTKSTTGNLPSFSKIKLFQRSLCGRGASWDNVLHRLFRIPDTLVWQHWYP